MYVLLKYVVERFLRFRFHKNVTAFHGLAMKKVLFETYFEIYHFFIRK